ncbi:DNA internalization-related competence protein ComEC/Rec2 [Clostridium aminobutyricum]|uniref:DNA internalization-related competence protein ComEC/Rec2 n=1 Tax=Clostridium aminobutyricum TaxID=33953 RepID=A0A939D751_CLOAM|nr:DNA internalization-related competence protein ComEC/Rec2 [Clostridium aminobutyricum]MBN7772749.1 DNA internalization-related competence protein ComEC/Rec2 [Clostridium aminobutyricum]
MRRPAAVACGTYILGMATEFFLDINEKNLVIAAIFTSIIFAWAHQKNRLYWKKNRYSLFLVGLFIFGLLQFSFAQNHREILSQHAGEYLTVYGRIVSIEQKDEAYYRAIVKVFQIESIGEINQEKVLINIYGECPDYYDFQGKNARFSGTLSLPSPKRNPRCFDYRQYLSTKNIFVIMTVNGSNYEPEAKAANSIAHWISVVKYDYKRNLYQIFDKEIAGLILGMVFGDSNGLEEDLYDSFQKNGICHILSVSGLHVAALYVCVNKLFGGRRHVCYNLLTLFLLLIYAALSNFCPPVIRAVVMISLHIFAKYMYCKYDMFTGSAITMAVMLFFNPLSLLNLGFQLSFLAIFTLAVILPAANRIYESTITAAMVAQVGIAPISAYVFNYFSFSAFVANIPVIFISGILIPISMFLLLLSILGGFGLYSVQLGDFFQIVSVMAEFLCKLLLYVNDLVYIEKVSFIYVVSPTLWQLILYYSFLFFCCSEYFRICFQRKQYKCIGKILILLVAVSFLFGNCFLEPFDKAQMVFIDVGQGDCLHIKTPDGKNILIDSGGSATKDIGKTILLPYFLKNGVKKIDLAFVTHLHTDHFGGLQTLTSYIDVEKLCLYEGNEVIEKNVEEMIGISKNEFIYLVQGQSIKVGDCVEIQVLYPPEKSIETYKEMAGQEGNENDSSLVFRILFNGVSTLMTGDIDCDGEMQLIRSNTGKIPLKTDILKVAHHGSKYSTSEEFVKTVSAKIAVIQVGKNNYGHPNADIIKRLEQNGTSVFRNDKNGALGIKVKKDGNIEVMQMISEDL